MTPFMAAALAEAAKGLGDTSPNPAVGAVIVRGKRIIARGYHQKFGGLHAEIEAINNLAGRDRRNLRNATMVVTLEPCNHYGKTPPCTDAILREKIGRVVAGIVDPHGIVAGMGLQRLKRAGVRVEVLNDPAVADFYRPYITFHRERRCYVTLKLAISADGKIAGGKSRWITGPAARAEVQRIRRRVDAILVGRRTAEIDNPRLTLRPPFTAGRRRAPARVILSAGGRLSSRLKVLHDVTAPTILATTPSRARLLANRLRRDGIQTLTVAARRDGLDLKRLLHQLAGLGMVHVLVEGGADTANRFLDQDAVDEVVLFVSPQVIGPRGLDAFRPRQSITAKKSDGFPWKLISKRAVGRDLMLVFRRS